MRWFQGSIPAAIASAKQQTFIFVVVITGDDDQSAQLMSSWEDDTVLEAAQTCVAIKVDAKSETCVQFSQIYPVVCIPSCFFIGENGIPLEVIAGSVSAEELTNRLDKVKQMHSLQMQGVGSEPEVPMEASPSVGVPTEPALQGPAPTEPISAPMELATEEPAEHAQPASTPATPKEPLTGSVDEGSSSGAAAASSDAATSNSSQPGENLEAKVDRLTKQLEDRRDQKKKEEEEEQIKREMERRKVGKDMVDVKRKQEDDKTKRLMDERNRDKAEEKAARDRVKQQIALDRAERAVRYGRNQEVPSAVTQQIALDRADRAVRYAKNQEDLEASRQAALQAKQAEMEARKEAKVRERSAIARIQFRLPDGSSFTNQFPSESRLQEARQFAVQEVGNRYGNFSLATMFPRREFTGEDLDKTLLELELAPSASVVLLPQTGRPNNTVIQSTSGGGSAGFWALLGHILYPLLAVWRFLSGFLFASPTGGPPAGPQRRPNNAHPRPGSSSAASSEEPQRETLRKRTLENRPDDFKKDGKIHRLRTSEDSEDENNTWNGNSTQQM